MGERRRPPSYFLAVDFTWGKDAEGAQEALQRAAALLEQIKEYFGVSSDGTQGDGFGWLHEYGPRGGARNGHHGCYVIVADKHILGDLVQNLMFNWLDYADDEWFEIAIERNA